MPNIPDINYTTINSSELRDSDYLRIIRELGSVSVAGLKLPLEEFIKLNTTTEEYRYPFDNTLVSYPDYIIAFPYSGGPLTEEYNLDRGCGNLRPNPTRLELNEWRQNASQNVQAWANLITADICGGGVGTGAYGYGYVHGSLSTLKIKMEQIAQVLIDEEGSKIDDYNNFVFLLNLIRDNIQTAGGDTRPIDALIDSCTNIRAKNAAEYSTIITELNDSIQMTTTIISEGESAAADRGCI